MFSRWPLTFRGTGAALLAAACLVLAQRFALAELLYLAVLLVLLVAGSIATLYLVRRTERVTRSFDPAVVSVGDEVVVRLRIEIRSPLPAAQGRWHDALPDGVHGEANGVFPETSSGVRAKGRDTELAYTATAARRGIRNIGPLSVVATDPFGPRVHPITGEDSFHTGADFAAPDGTPILAAASGTVTVAEFSGGYGGLVVIEHRIDGRTVATAYAHSWQHGIHVSVGDQVRAGQHIADVGSSGMSTGPHLHFEVRDGGTNGEFIDPAAWLNQHDAADLPEAEVGPPNGCRSSTGTAGDPAPFDGDDPNRMVDDPTSNGQITARMLHLYEQTLAQFPDIGWGCYSPRPGTTSEHPLGRACDLTFGNAIGQYPTAEQLDYGWQVTEWMQTHAEALGVEYLIWQGKIWSLSRDAEGWRPYNGGGMHDPDNVTGGHYDHLHVTVK